MIIDKTYIHGKINIPFIGNANEPSVDTQGNQNRVNQLILECQEFVLVNALGSSLANGVLSALEVDGTFKPTATQAIKDLVDGKTYTSGTKSKTWKGLRYTLGTAKYSLIADYLYYAFISEDVTHLSAGGLKKLVGNNENINVIAESSQAYNRFLKQYQGTRFKEPTPVYNRSGMIGLDWYTSENNEVCLLEFLEDNSTGYDFEFTILHESNELGI